MVGPRMKEAMQALLEREAAGTSTNSKPVPPTYTVEEIVLLAESEIRAVHQAGLIKWYKLSAIENSGNGILKFIWNTESNPEGFDRLRRDAEKLAG